MASPPSYDKSVNAKQADQARLPPYRASHTFANSQEELAALQDFANSKLYVRPGTHGTLQNLGPLNGTGGLKSLVRGGFLPGEVGWEKGWPLPETDEERKVRLEEEKMKKREEKELRHESVVGRKGSVGERLGGKLKRVISAGGMKDEGDGAPEIKTS